MRLDNCCCSVTKSCPTLFDPMDCSLPGSPVLQYLPEFAQIHVHWVGDTIQLSHLLSFPSPPALIFPSIRVFSNESALHIRYWNFSFSNSPSNEYSGLISFRIDWFDLIAVQGTLKSLLQHHSSKASIFWCSVFFNTAIICEPWKIDAFELWCWRRLLRVPWTARRSNQSILKEVNPEYSLEGLMLKL